MSIPAKLNPNAATLSKLDGVNHFEVMPVRVSSSKRTTAPSGDHPTSKSHYGTRSARLKEKGETGVHRSTMGTAKKPDSDSEEVYTAPSKQDKHPQEDEDDAYEDSIVVRPSRIRTEHLSPTSIPSNNSAMGDYYRSSSNPTKIRNKINRKYPQLLDERTLDAKNIYLWRLALSLILMGVLIFVIYRSLLAVWPKPKKSLLERAIDDLFGFFTL